MQGLDILSKEPKGVDSIDLVSFLLLLISFLFCNLFSVNIGNVRAQRDQSAVCIKSLYCLCPTRGETTETLRFQGVTWLNSINKP